LKKIIQKLLLFSPVLFVIAGVNCFVDPANLFNSKQYVKGIADYLLEGKNVTGIYNYDYVLLQKYFITGLKECPDIVVLGPSTTMGISSVSFCPKTLINNSVASASLKELLAIYRLYEKKGFKPKKVILGLAPWFLSENNKNEQWKSLSLEYFEMLKELGINNKEVSQRTIIPGKYNQIFSISYFRASMNFLLNRKSKEYFPTDKILNEEQTILKDGSISRNKKERNKTPQQVTEEVKYSINTIPNFHGLDRVNELSELEIKKLEKFIVYLKKQNTEIIFFLPPYHPLVFDYITCKGNHKILIKTEEYYRSLAKKMNIEIFGAFNPERYKLDSSAFYDIVHCREEAIKTMLLLK